jgi:hypothetical protein
MGLVSSLQECTSVGAGKNRSIGIGISGVLLTELGSTPTKYKEIIRSVRARISSNYPYSSNLIPGNHTCQVIPKSAYKFHVFEPSWAKHALQIQPEEKLFLPSNTTTLCSI